MVQPETIPVQGPAGRKDYGGDIAALRQRVTELTKLVAQMQGRLEALEADRDRKKAERAQEEPGDGAD